MEKRSHTRRKDRRRDDYSRDTVKPFMQAPVILERPNRVDVPVPETVEERKPIEPTKPPRHEESRAVIPMFRRNTKFQIESVLKYLGDYPGHFVMGVVGRQGVGKSTLLSSFMQASAEEFPVQSNSALLYEGHKTLGIDMHITPERIILLDTEPLLSWSSMDKTLKAGGFEGLPPDVWLEMECIYQLAFMLSVCNVVMVVLEGAAVDTSLLQNIRKAEILKSNLQDFPLIPLSNLPSDPHTSSNIVFVGNKCQDVDFTWQHYEEAQSIIKSIFSNSSLKTSGLVSLGHTLPFFELSDPCNLYYLPQIHPTSSIESFEVLVTALRDQMMAAPRRSGKRGQLSEKEWFRNAVKTYELIRKSEPMVEYAKLLKKLRES
ncbi:hypothetical protein BDF14DRAFT_1819129 [Spinellus fusiger]|nr:hypothetical protein BDF14DRAFT_1819129 [Spinellus fusiger]